MRCRVFLADLQLGTQISYPPHSSVSARCLCSTGQPELHRESHFLSAAWQVASAGKHNILPARHRNFTRRWIST